MGLIRTLVISAICAIALTASADPKPIKQTANLEHGQILKGYDPVSYFTSTKPLKGKPEIKSEINGVTYLFATKENQQLFLKDSKKYSPEYEGWCATAVAKGYKYDIDPENYKVTNGRLFLFYKGWKGDAKKDWDEKEVESTKKADANWSTVRETAE